MRVKFVKHSLGNAPSKARNGRLVFARSTDNRVMFLQSWHRGNMALAARVLGRHQSEVGKILWDVEVDGVLRHDCWYHRHYSGNNGKRRFACHEAFFPGQVVGINCVVPTAITDEDLLQLMNIAGRYKGLSPYSPGEYGQFQVAGIAPRRGPEHAEETAPEPAVEKVDVIV